jgi:predicted RNase H-like nuclease (RuvC/YqgF family)
LVRNANKPGNVSKRQPARTVLYTTYDNLKKKLTTENKKLKVKLENIQADNAQFKQKVDTLLKQKTSLERKNLTIEDEKSVAYDNLIEELRNTLNVDARTEAEILNAVRRLKTRALDKEGLVDDIGIVKPKDLRKVRILRGSIVNNDWRGIKTRHVAGTDSDILEMRASALPDQPAEMFEDLGPAD